jgi:hypothetical protein
MSRLQERSLYRSAVRPVRPAPAKSCTEDATGRRARFIVVVVLANRLDAYSHAIPAMQEEAAALIAELVFVVK